MMSAPQPPSTIDSAAVSADQASNPARRTFLRAGASSTLAALATSPLAACGGGDDTAPPPAPPPPPQAENPPLPTARFADNRALLSEPTLQNPGADSVRVVWFSETAAGKHTVRAGTNLEREFTATTTKMSRMLEDSGSQVFQRITSTLTLPQARDVYRHEAVVTGLTPGQRVPYVAISEFEGTRVRSGQYTLQATPPAGQALKILLTSDQQNNPMAAANFQKVAETIGPVDAVLFPGDFVSQPNRASEWFDRVSISNPSFFQSLQGTMQRWNPGSVYKGGEILQHAPLFGCLGNHEYPGRWRPTVNNINTMDGDPQPRWFAELRYEQQKAALNPTNDPAVREQWIADNSFEFNTYREMWSLPEGSEGPEGKAYYGVRFGDVFIISLDANRIWRSWNAVDRGKFTERWPQGATQVTQNTDEWGFGDFTFRPFAKGSQQYQWLEQTLQSEACRSAKYRIVLSHQTMAGLGDNAVPVHAEIRATIELTDGSLIGPFGASEFPARWPQIQAALDASRVKFVRYEYPLAGDQWKNDIEPLLQANNVQLVHTGHSHLWNRCTAGKLHYLESANVGNSFGAMYFATAQTGTSASQGPRGTQPGNAAWRSATVATTPPRTALEWNPADYPTHGEPHGRPMIQPTLVNPMKSLEGRPEDLPFVASNLLTSFSILDTGTGLVSSYVFDTRTGSGQVVKFDEFLLA
jgi:Calcineurin-like phosphoesterase